MIQNIPSVTQVMRLLPTSLRSLVDSPGVFPLARSCRLRYPAVMAGTAAERLRLVYALLAFLYVGLGLDFYLTARLWRSAVRDFAAYPEDLNPPGELKRSKRQYPEDSGIPSVEFFPQPQPTHETDGYVWLTSYSRIPVSVSLSVVRLSSTERDGTHFPFGINLGLRVNILTFLW